MTYDFLNFVGFIFLLSFAFVEPHRPFGIAFLTANVLQPNTGLSDVGGKKANCALVGPVSHIWVKKSELSMWRKTNSQH